MASKETALVPVNDYSVLQMDTEMMKDLLNENLLGESLSMWDLTKINIPTGGGTKWIVPSVSGDDEYLDHIDGVILHHSINRNYWKGSETGTSTPDGSPPDCTSPDGARGFGDPGVPVQMYQYPAGESGPDAYDCKTCPLAQWGSGRNGGMACKMTRPIFILRENDMLPSLVVAPPASINAVRYYMLDLFKEGVHFANAVTRLSLVKEENKQGISYAKLKLSLVDRVAPDSEHGAFLKQYGQQIRETFADEGVQPLTKSEGVADDDSEHDETELPFD